MGERERTGENPGKKLIQMKSDSAMLCTNPFENETISRMTKQIVSSVGILFVNFNAQLFSNVSLRAKSKPRWREYGGTGMHTKTKI